MSTLYSTVPHVTFDQFQFPCKESKLLNHQVETRQTSTLFRFDHSAPSRAIQHTVKNRKDDFQTTHQEWCTSSKENFCKRGFLNTKKCARSASGNIGRFPFNQNVRKFGNSGKWYGTFPGKVSRNSENC